MELPVITAMAIKTSALFLLTLLCFRIMGYRSLGDMEPLDYVIVLGIGEILGSPLSNPDENIFYAAVAIVVLTLFQLLISSLYARLPRLNKVMEGGPVQVIKNGEILERNLLRNRIDMASVMEELRIKGLRDEKDVDLAYLEPSGRFSVILKNEASPLTPRYFGEKGSLILVEKGEIRPENWREGNIDKDTLLGFLEEENISHWSEIESLLYKNGVFFLRKKKNS